MQGAIYLNSFVGLSQTSLAITMVYEGALDIQVKTA